MPVSFERALALVDGSLVVENTEKGIRVITDQPDESFQRIVDGVAAIHNLKPNPNEIASPNTLVYIEKAYDEIDEDDVLDDEEYTEDEDENEADTPPENGEDISDVNSQLDILSTQEGMKLANSLYSKMLGNVSFSSFPQFLVDFEDFLSRYKGEEFDDGTQVEEVMEETDGDQAIVALASALEIASEIEESKKKESYKKGRAGVLSVLMKAISGDAGDKIVSAWDSADKSKLKNYLHEAIDKVVDHLPDEKLPEDEEKTE